MIFLNDVFERFSKLYDSLDSVYASVPIAQKTKSDFNRLLLSGDYFATDIYVNSQWLEENKEIITGFFNFFDGKEAMSDYMYGHIINSETFSSNTDRSNPLMAVVFASALLMADESTLSQLRLNSSSYIFVLVINDGVSAADLKPLRFNCTGRIDLLPVEGLKNVLLHSVIDGIFKRDSLKEMHTLYALKSIRPQLQDVLRYVLSDKKTLDRLIVRRDELKEKKDKIFSDNTGVEQANKLKLELQKSLREIDRQLRNRYSEFALPNRGEFSKMTEAIVVQLLTLDTRDANDRFPKILTTVPGDFVKFAETNMQNRLLRLFSEDVRDINNRIGDIRAKIAHFQSNELSQMLTKMVASIPKPERVVNAYVHLSALKDYKGDMPKVTMQSSLMMVRQQTMFIFIILSLLTPLLQLPSLLMDIGGNNSNTNTNVDPDVQKAIENQHIQQVNNYHYFQETFTILVGLTTLGFSIYYIMDLKKKLPLMREELIQKELDRVKNMTKQEMQKIFADASREWLNNINNWLSENQENFYAEVDRVAIEFNRQKTVTNAGLEKDYQAAIADYNNQNQVYTGSERLLQSILNDQLNAISQLEVRINNYSNNLRN